MNRDILINCNFHSTKPSLYTHSVPQEISIVIYCIKIKKWLDHLKWVDDIKKC